MANSQGRCNRNLWSVCGNNGNVKSYKNFLKSFEVQSSVQLKKLFNYYTLPWLVDSNQWNSVTAILQYRNHSDDCMIFYIENVCHSHSFRWRRIKSRFWNYQTVKNCCRHAWKFATRQSNRSEWWTNPNHKCHFSYFEKNYRMVHVSKQGSTYRSIWTETLLSSLSL